MRDESVGEMSLLGSGGGCMLAAPVLGVRRFIALFYPRRRGNVYDQVQLQEEDEFAAEPP